MCLEIITSTTRDRNREGIGWKVFVVGNGSIMGIYYGGPWKKNVWLKSKDDHSEGYKLGFHLFRTRREARANASRHLISHRTKRVMKVKFRDVLSEGTQSCLRIIVAKEMLIL